jgi:hypothetical protein
MVRFLTKRYHSIELSALFTLYFLDFRGRGPGAARSVGDHVIFDTFVRKLWSFIDSKLTPKSDPIRCATSRPTTWYSDPKV